MNADTPLKERMYYRCHDCLATVCIDKPQRQPGQWVVNVECGLCNGPMIEMGHVVGSKWVKAGEVCDCNEECQSATGLSSL